MKRSNAQLRLIETAPAPKPEVSAEPSEPQLKALRQLRAGATLVYRSAPMKSVHLETERPGEWLLIHPSTARILVAYGWVELAKFSGRVGEYRLSSAGSRVLQATGPKRILA
jgi:hypothetical protein